MSAGAKPSLYQDHLTVSVSLCPFVLGRPLLPASFHVAAQSCCFQASTGGQAASYLTHCCCCWWFSTRGQVALLLLLPNQHSR
ncbi:hypothetical protein WJX79_009102 [Trebouxia sp. C0005]